ARVYTREEIQRLGDLCVQYGVIISSDEIHCDLVLDGSAPHIPTATVSPEIGQSCITFMAPSKTYNVPGLACCFAVIENSKIRQSFKRAIKGIIPDVNILGLVAAEVAYADCQQWQQDLIAYLSINRDILQDRIGAMSGLKMHHVEATYLAWIDARELETDKPAQLFEDAGVVLSDGAYFGLPGYVRFNFGCPRSIMEESLDRMAAALLA
ncbi:MAG: aminotransferase class I/II-fold pyridoxal phosphate-dependent enzyme, partial [Planctomycetes bacterium]|nr:aminotransferase class I/II-fold pyridoxal phosphate-dependent enzyme [Planctomycetota bacterium]